MMKMLVHHHSIEVEVEDHEALETHVNPDRDQN